MHQANSEVTAAKDRFHTRITEFQGHMSDLRYELLTMRARLIAFDRHVGVIQREITKLNGLSNDLARTMDRAIKQAA